VLGLLQRQTSGSPTPRVREVDPEILERIKRATRIIQGREEEPETRTLKSTSLSPVSP